MQTRRLGYGIKALLILVLARPPKAQKAASASDLGQELTELRRHLHV